MRDNELADIGGQGKYRRVQVQRVVDAPIERVWDAITKADQVRQWWAAGEIDPREGGRVKLGMDSDDCGDEDLELDGRIKVFLPPHVFEFTWNEAYDPAMGLVRFDLVELDANKTQITLINIVPAKDVLYAAAGWHQIVERLGDYFDNGGSSAVPEDDGRLQELHSLYAAVVG